MFFRMYFHLWDLISCFWEWKRNFVAYNLRSLILSIDHLMWDGFFHHADEKRKLNVVNICWLFTHSCIILYFEKLQKVFSRCSICYMVKTFAFNVTKMLERFVKNELRWNHQSVKRGNRLRMAEDSKFLLTQEHHLQNALYYYMKYILNSQIHYQFYQTKTAFSIDWMIETLMIQCEVLSYH